jgi:superfamily I DNA and/or RNA helicase
VQGILALPAARQADAVALRKSRLARVVEHGRQRIGTYRKSLRDQEGEAVRKARVVLATMTNVYVSRLLADERFDVIVVEEAGMAVLPTLFFCSALAREKVIMVGDPRQLPPIVQSDDPYVRKAMGRSIFEVTVPSLDRQAPVVMLDTQYRMHPVIGDLVSALFYSGNLVNGENTPERQAIADRPPCPGRPLAVVDTEGSSTCARQEGEASRLNEATAALCVDLAIEGVRQGIESVAIITPYVAQSREIRRRLAGFRRDAERIECRTVHRFQGGERDMVVLDLVDAHPMRPGVLLCDDREGSQARNLINVSISRARGKLVIVADVLYFRRKAAGSAIDRVLRLALEKGVRVSSRTIGWGSPSADPSDSA